jgi:hypothetical protein
MVMAAVAVVMAVVVVLEAEVVGARTRCQTSAAVFVR